MTAITRHFVTVDGRWGTRQVHYRRAGQGPAVLALHQSPQSSRDLLPVLEAWRTHFTLIAPDTPGYGQSDPLGRAALTMADFAAATLEFADAVGLRRFGVYGYHTGASIGLMLAASHPERVAALAAQGLVRLTAEELRDILAHYLPPFVPSWDGAHLAWAWARMREQTIFFPWYERTRAARLPFDVPSPERLQAGLLDMLRTGAGYAVAYRAAFESRPQDVLPRLAVPLLVTAAADDPLHEHLARLQDLPPDAATRGAPTHADALAQCLHHLLAHRADPAPAPVATRPVPGRPWRQMLRTATGEVSVCASVEGREAPVLLVHDAGGSSVTVERLVAPLLGTHPFVAPDLPGHGESAGPRRPAGPTLADCAESVHAVLNGFALNRVVLAGAGAGAWVALEATRRGLQPPVRLVLLDVPWLDAPRIEAFQTRGLPSLAPLPHGGHLLEAWHMLRDARLFFPWFEPAHRNALDGTPELDPERIQLELTELLKAEGAWQNLASEALAYDARRALQGLGATAVLGASAGRGWIEPTRAAAALAPGLRFVACPADPARILPTLLVQQA
jgi:pimeloyl-ACP methyl ester carboxylesterase